MIARTAGGTATEVQMLVNPPSRNDLALRYIIPIAPLPGTPVPRQFAAGSRAMVRIWTGTMTASAANNAHS